MARASKYADSRDVILQLLARTEQEHGRAPTVRQIADEADVGLGTAHSYVVRLEAEGYIERQHGHRRMRLTERGREEATALGPVP